MLTSSLLDSKWFLPLEREGLQNLLTERKLFAPRRRKMKLQLILETTYLR